MNQITRRCCYCRPPHIMGKDYGPPYTDGLCWWAGFKEDVKWYTPRWLRTLLKRPLENLIAPLALLYLLAQIARWAAMR